MQYYNLQFRKESSPINNATAHYFATNIKYDDYGKGIFDLLIDGKYVDAISLNVVGIHNISNSLPSIARLIILVFQ